MGADLYGWREVEGGMRGCEHMSGEFFSGMLQES